MPATPVVLVVVTGEGFLGEYARSCLHNYLRGSYLGNSRRNFFISTPEDIPVLNERLRAGALPRTWAEIKGIVPPDSSQILLLAEIREIPARISGARFDLQAFDMDTGAIVRPLSSDSCGYAEANLREVLRNTIYNAAQGFDVIIERYWERKKAAAGGR